ncbi:hypothetical protein FRC19_011055 [Serendipita sp. 401]|nr:hypothetical protein FRC19_011055 [Serendipita sp. 401]
MCIDDRVMSPRTAPNLNARPATHAVLKVTFPVIAPVQSKPRPTEAVTPSPSRPSFHSFGGRVDVSVESCSRPVLSSPYDDQASYGSTFPFFCPSHMCFMYVLISDTVSRHRVKIRST